MASIISAGTSSGTSLNLTGDTSGVLQLASNNGTTAVTVDTSQNVMVGGTTNTYGGKVEVYSSGNTRLDIATTGATSQQILSFDQNGSAKWQIISDLPASGSGRLDFVKPGSGSQMTIDSSGRVTMPYQSGFMAGIASTSDATISQNSLVPFNTVTSTNAFNTGTNFNTSTNLFTAPVSGRYVFSFTLYFTNSGGSTGNMSAAIRVNGSFISFTSGDAYGFLSATPNSTGGVITSSTSVVLNLSANDTVGVAAKGASIRIYPGNCFFSGYLLG